MNAPISAGRLSPIALLLAVTACGAAHAQNVRYVNVAAPAGGNGLTWATAYNNVKTAVAAAVGNPAIKELWIAQGVYDPGTAPYTLKNGLTLYGGFEGDETSLAQRDIDAFPTVFTGQGSHRIINGGTVNATAVVDGITLRDGFSATEGGAVLGGNATFRRCRFESNEAGTDGGAWYGYGNSPRFVQCVFVDNVAGDSGGALNTYEGSLTIVNGTFLGNQAATGGGAVYTYAGTITMTNSLVAKNAAGDGAGGVETYEGPVVIAFSTIADNQGGGVAKFTGPALDLRSSIVWNNGVSGPAIGIYSCVQGGVPGVGNIATDPLFANPAENDWRLAIGSPAIDAGNNSALQADTFDLDGDGNVTQPLPVDLALLVRRRDDPTTPDTGAGTAPIVDMGAFEHFPDCNGNGIEDANDIASGTSADIDGNGTPDECEDCNGNRLPDGLDIANGTSGDCQKDGIPDECQIGQGPTIAYGIDDGSSENEIGLVNGGDFAWLNRFTVAEGGEILRELRFAWGSGLPEGAFITVYVWNDPNQDGNPKDSLVIRSELAKVVAPGTDLLQTIDIADTYVGPAGTTYFVGAIINAGIAIAPLDQSGSSQQRSWIAATAGGQVNPNALGDSGLFGLVDSFNFPGNWLVRAVGWRELDCNGNGVPDDCDLANGFADCQGDGIPDVCQLDGNDCNQNGVPDDCDLADGTLSDCQPNGKPDACEIAAGDVTDLDRNGVPDVCEDCDGNGLPDALDLANGAPDCQGDGVLDACQLGSPDPVEYALDDANPEFYVASDAPNMGWLINYVIEPGRERISAINVMDGQMPLGAPVDVYLWSDPNNDGDPTDAKVLAHVATTVQNPLLFVYNRVDIPDVYVGPAGTSFFVGAIASFTPFTDFPAPKDSLFKTGTSWLVGKFSAIDPNDLSADADEFLKIDDLGGPFIGVWCVRAEAIEWNDCNENAIPDDCDIADGTSADANNNDIPDECEEFVCVGDLDGDGTVGPTDLGTLLGAWGTRGAADLNGDGTVDPTDLGILLGAWGGC
ncbi:MAG: hypothetical protein JNM94_11300 [Phycisphaerae bacterium]|nr:hypothetical protein [Phycisphaerae bacterium]